jgi:hypothetical protein
MNHECFLFDGARLWLSLFCIGGLTMVSAQQYVPPSSPRISYNFNSDWKFIRSDVTNGRDLALDDSKWTTVSAPHTYNEVDTYDEIISHSGGERHQYTGIAWYRKHFRLPLTAQGRKGFIEFEGLKQAGRFWINGQVAGKYENGATPCEINITPLVKVGDVDKVIAVKVDNSSDYREETDQTIFESPAQRQLTAKLAAHARKLGRNTQYATRSTSFNLPHHEKRGTFPGPVSFLSQKHRFPNHSR